MSDSPQYPDGHRYPEESEPTGGYEPPPLPPRPRFDPPTPEPAREEPPPVAAERFRRTSPARLRAIPVERGRGYWRLITGTLVYVMIVGGMADYVDPSARAVAHLVFWALIAVAFGVTVARERRNDWSPEPRWPWAVAAIGGALITEVLIIAVGSPAIIVGSIILAALGLFVLMLAG
ncbi:hypothetical protein [Nocardiopsis lambiniae]|uniref:Uncharacterized protein n=1 Tax=Nocardiopsis lambiniae TaxID=3075539 RepID=A0ABU2M8N6_9ACTN|nr:hypothetical protein [Nocardiopsis sp. DSM 44743]MDT0329027.1 hypothetical protein [Nocardiopsis sp. DSM 44743]